MRLKLLVFPLMLLVPLIHLGQGSVNEPIVKNYLTISGGYSFHGSGDMRGVNQSVSFGRFLSRKLFWQSSVGWTLHDGEFPLFTIVDGKKYDNSFRYTTGGFQLLSGFGFTVVKSVHHNFGLNLSGLVRYQSSSYFDHLETFQDPNGPIPFPATYIFNDSKQRTWSIGVSPALFYRYAFENGLMVGLESGIQFDTHGDVISNVSLTIGRCFNRFR